MRGVVCVRGVAFVVRRRYFLNKTDDIVCAE